MKQFNSENDLTNKMLFDLLLQYCLDYDCLSVTEAADWLIEDIMDYAQVHPDKFVRFTEHPGITRTVLAESIYDQIPEVERRLEEIATDNRETLEDIEEARKGQY